MPALKRKMDGEYNHSFGDLVKEHYHSAMKKKDDDKLIYLWWLINFLSFLYI